jgi:general secretion pathway protein H
MLISLAGNSHIRDYHTTGMSLIELLVVLSIISGVLYVVTPNFYNGFDSLRMKQLVRNIVSDLRLTQSSALKTGKQQTWTLDVKKHQYWSSLSGEKTNYPINVNIELTTASQEQLTDDIAAIRFFPSGGATGGKLELRQDAMSYTLSVDWLTGIVSVDD